MSLFCDIIINIILGYWNRKLPIFLQILPQKLPFMASISASTTRTSCLRADLANNLTASYRSDGLNRLPWRVNVSWLTPKRRHANSWALGFSIFCLGTVCRTEHKPPFSAKHSAHIRNWADLWLSRRPLSFHCRRHVSTWNHEYHLIHDVAILAPLIK